MKKGVIIVNTARGGVMDEAALVKALEDGVVESVGLDVFEEEPKVHPGLVTNEKVTLLPHMGTWTVEVSPLSSILMPSVTGRTIRFSRCVTDIDLLSSRFRHN